MTTTRHRLRFAIALAATLILPGVAHADVVWPALVVVPRLLGIRAVLLGLVVETLMLRFRFAMTWRRATIAAVVANAISSLAGIVLVPLAGVLWEILPGTILIFGFGMRGFSPVEWAATFCLALAVTTGIEVAILHRLFAVPASERTWLLWTLANAVSVGLAFATLITDKTDFPEPF